MIPDDGLERYLGRRRRRQKFAITIRDPAQPNLWARLKFEDSPLTYVIKNGAIRLESRLDDPDPALRPQLGLEVHGSLDERLAGQDGYTSLTDLVASGLAEFVGRMADHGWTDPRGFSDRGYQVYWFRRQRPPDGPATLAAIARDAAAALLGTDRYILATEPYRGDSGLIGEYAGYRSLSTMGGFVVTAPVVVILVALLTQNPSEVALVAGALVAIAVLYGLLGRGRNVARSRPTLDVDLALVRLEMAVGESAVAELPIVGPPVELVLSLAVALVGVWLPIVVAVVITSAV
jgi:hypothetical protein